MKVHINDNKDSLECAEPFGQENNSVEIELEKLKWLESVNAKVFNEPLKYLIGKEHWLLSEEYLKNTPLPELIKRYERLK